MSKACQLILNSIPCFNRLPEEDKKEWTRVVEITCLVLSILLIVFGSLGLAEISIFQGLGVITSAVFVSIGGLVFLTISLLSTPNAKNKSNEENAASRIHPPMSTHFGHLGAIHSRVVSVEEV